jgi:hypothetical protein
MYASVSEVVTSIEVFQLKLRVLFSAFTSVTYVPQLSQPFISQFP